LFVTRTERWFFMRPFPAAPLFLAILMCALGWLVEPISWTLIAWIWAYNLAWMFLLGAVRLITERFVDFRTARHIRSLEVVNQSLQTHA
jgi:H+-transporting ATPase